MQSVVISDLIHLALLPPPCFVFNKKFAYLSLLYYFQLCKTVALSNTMANLFLMIIYTFCGIGFLVQMYFVTQALRAPSFSDMEMKLQKLGL